jgi:hypothetical protein
MSGATIVVRANFDRKPAGRGEAKDSTGRRSPGVARLLALAHQIDRKVRDGELRDYAHAAKVLGLTRARVSQISGLTLLAPAIQEAILDLPPTTRDPVTERQLREIVTEPLWERQMRLWRLVRRHR